VRRSKELVINNNSHEDEAVCGNAGARWAQDKHSTLVAVGRCAGRAIKHPGGGGRAKSRTGFSLRGMSFVTRPGRPRGRAGDGSPLATTAAKSTTLVLGNRCQFHATPVGRLGTASGFIRKVVVTI
jgi:hypothetical protein